MKTKLNKSIIISLVIFIIVTLSIIGIATLINKNTEVPKNEITEKIDFVKEFENVSISGDINNIYEVKINEIIEESKDFKPYANVINNIKGQFEENITKSVIYEVKFLDKMGNEVVPSRPVTVYIKPKYINVYDGSGFELLKLEQNNGKQMYDWKLRTDLGETTLCVEIEKSENLVLLCWGDKKEEPKYNTTNQMEKEALDMNISKDYKMPEISYEEMKEKYNVTSSMLVDGINHINKFDGALIYLYEVEFQLDAEGHGIQETLTPINSYTSFVYLNNKKDVTTNMVTEQKERKREYRRKYRTQNKNGRKLRNEERAKYYGKTNER